MAGGGATTPTDTADVGSFMGGPSLPSGPQQGIGPVGGNNAIGGNAGQTPAWVQALAAVGGLGQGVGQAITGAMGGTQQQPNGGQTAGLLGNNVNQQATAPSNANITGFQPLPAAQPGQISPALQQALMRILSGGSI